MKVTLKDIDESNWIECILLTTDPDKKYNLNEEFVASNAVSIAQSKVEKGWITKAIYNEDTMVGFAMYGLMEKNDYFEICRIMIDHKYQRKGFGREALRLILDELTENKNCTEVYISFDPNNHSAQKLYEDIGFENTGRIMDDEMVYCLKIEDGDNII